MPKSKTIVSTLTAFAAFSKLMTPVANIAAAPTTAIPARSTRKPGILPIAKAR